MSQNPSSNKTTPEMPTGSKQSADVSMKLPPTDSVTEKAAAPLATLSSHVDPWPHYIMSLACGSGGAYAYTRLNNPRASAIAAGFAAAYLYAGSQLANGNEQFGYDLGTATSIALAAAVGPRAYHTGEAYSVAMASLGGISTVANLVKSWQFRTGKPREMEEGHRVRH